MMAALIVWPGSDAERDALNMAMMRNCQCPVDGASLGAVCAAHSMLADERVLHHLVFARRNRAVYIGLEWKV